ncbi:MAG: TolC family protein [Treponema sp.]|nr:TolC family protein [Treponema sp.]
MKLRLRTIVTAFLFLIPAVVLSAQSVSVQPESDAGNTEGQLSLALARSLALAKSAAVRKYTLAVDEAALVKQAQVYAALPDLSASAAAAYDIPDSLPDGVSASAGLAASATVFDGGKNIVLSRKYDFALQAARENLRAGRISVIDTVDSAFFSVLECQASFDAAQSDLNAAKLRLEIAQAKADAGALSKSDLLETESEIASYQAALDKAKAALISAEVKLSSLTGRPALSKPVPVDFTVYDTVIRKLGALEGSALDTLIASVVTTARANSPTYSASVLSAKEAGQTLTAAKTACLPTVSAALSGKYTAGTGTSDTSAGVTLSAAMDLDVWTLRNSIKQAQNALAQADAGTAEDGETLDLNVAQAVCSWISSAMAIPSCVTALSYAGTNYENVLEKFKLSIATTSDVSTAQALVSADETALISAQYAFLSSLSTLRGLAGLEGEADIIAAVK